MGITGEYLNFRVDLTWNFNVTNNFRFLQFHPLLRSAASELYFFNKHYDEGIDWYYKQFENVAVHNRNLTLFEKTPTYYQNPNVPERVKKEFPDIKLIISGLPKLTSVEKLNYTR